MNFSRHRQRFITVDEMNQHLKYVFEYYEVVFRDKTSSETFKRKAFIHDGLVKFTLTYKKGSYACTYICRKDTAEAAQYCDGGEAFRIMSQYYKVPRMTEEVVGREIRGKADNGGLSASPLLWSNPKYEGKWEEAYGYDLNSAYAAAMIQPVPDTSVPPKAKIIGPNEIGFMEAVNPKNPNRTMLVPKFSGFALWTFPLMESPFKRFVNNWYKKKSESPPGSKERQKAKDVLNMSVGQLQNVNPFIRATIVGRCNNLIQSLIDDGDTLFCNTDSIVSRKPLPQLVIGTAVGEWKLEKVGKVAYIGNNYQWDLGDGDIHVSYRGIPKTWFKKGWDITKDRVPNFGNIYEFKNNRLELVKYENI